MISKPLFKQSCKANAGIWAFVTTITCFMLAVVIMVLGNLNVNKIGGAMFDMFVKDAIETSVQEQSLTYYNMVDQSLSNYDTQCDALKNLFNNQTTEEQREGIITNYNALIAAGKTDAEARALIKANMEATTVGSSAVVDPILNYYLYQKNAGEWDETAGADNYSDTKVEGYVLNQIANAIYNQILIENDENTANNAKSFIETAIKAYAESGSHDVSKFSANYIPQVLSGVYIDQKIPYHDKEIAISKYFEKEDLENISHTAIVTYRARIKDKEEQLRAITPALSEVEIQVKLKEYSATIVKEISENMFESLPKNVTDALNEITTLNVYELVVGSIFFKIAGLLLPMIFVIMAANNLVAGQVDSGSMAYVLSTPTKRKTVSITQMFYLVSSLFAMFLLTTITSVVCLALVQNSGISITYGQIVLFNVGAFVTMFAISGICFLASSWFNRNKVSMGCGGGLTMFFLVATILGLFGSKAIPSAVRIEAMDFFNYTTILTLFDTMSITAGTLTFLWKWAILVVLGIVCYAVSVVKFDKKDLPL